MKVKFFAYLRDPDYAGCKEASITGAESVRDLGNRIGELFGNKILNEFFSPDRTEIGERIIVLVNGRRIEFLDGLDTKLKESDVVQVFPVVAGG